MVLKELLKPLQLTDVPIPSPGPKQLLVKVEACGVCRTDLHVADGELPSPVIPIIPGHQIVGTVVGVGSDAKTPLGTRIGIPWLGGCCHHCRYCLDGRENLCDNAIFTGFQVNGGFAEYCVADEEFCFPIPKMYSAIEAAPLLCAGLIGYRSLKLAGEGRRIGFYGFGAAAHILIQVALIQGREVYAFTRPGDTVTQKFAKELGAVWSGGSDEKPPKDLDAAIIFASVGALVPTALKATGKGGVVVCAGIHMSDIPSFPYEILWGERVLRSVANLTRQDGIEFFTLAAKVKLKTHIKTYSLEDTNEALDDLRHGRFQGAAVIDLISSNH
jgi:propanol-preferring alcohol dehydrogenase